MAIYRYKSSQRFEKPDGWIERSGVNEHGNAWESRSRKYKPVYADVELEIDTEELMRRLGFKALVSKRKRSAALYGLIRVKVVRERDA